MVFMIGAVTTSSFADTPVGSITVNKAIQGAKYSAYRVLNLNESASERYQFAFTDTWAELWQQAYQSGYVDRDGRSIGLPTEGNKLEPLSEMVLDYIQRNSDSIRADQVAVSAPASASATTFRAVFTNLPCGFYMIIARDNDKNVVSRVFNYVTPDHLDAVTEEKTIDKPTTEKQVKEDSTGSWGGENDAAIGDTVEFRSKITVIGNITELVYHDTMSEGLTWTGVSDTKVYTDQALTTEFVGSYTVAKGTDPDTFTVTFTDIPAGAVWVGYKAVLNTKASVSSPETNQGYITWNNNGRSDSVPTNTRTYDFKLLKYDGSDNNKNPLAGAEFELYTTDDGSGEPLKLIRKSNTEYCLYVAPQRPDPPAPPTEDPPESPKRGTGSLYVTTIETVEGSPVTITGLDSDQYFLKETKAPDGYNRISGWIPVVYDNGHFTSSITNTTDNTVEVENNTGAQLPSTGGPGTGIFTVSGLLLIAACGILLTLKRKKSRL